MWPGHWVSSNIFRWVRLLSSNILFMAIAGCVKLVHSSYDYQLFTLSIQNYTRVKLGTQYVLVYLKRRVGAITTRMFIGLWLKVGEIFIKNAEEYKHREMTTLLRIQISQLRSDWNKLIIEILTQTPTILRSLSSHSKVLSSHSLVHIPRFLILSSQSSVFNPRCITLHIWYIHKWIILFSQMCGALPNNIQLDLCQSRLWLWKGKF